MSGGGKSPIQVGSGCLHDHKALRSSEFAAVKKTGTSLKGKYLIINLISAPDHQTRLGIIVSKRFSLKAVTRNRARRLIRESFRLLRHGISEQLWLVVIARKHLQTASLQDVQQEFIGLLNECAYWQSDE